MPVTNERAVAKAQQLAADTLVLDLEDAVLPEAKVQARKSLRHVMATHDYSYREVLVRINGFDSPWWRDDLESLADLPVDGVVLPKVETRSSLAAVAEVMGSVKNGPDALWIMLESPRGVINAAELCGFGDPIAGVMLGTADLGKAMNISGIHPAHKNRLGLQNALSHCVLSARAADIAILDGVYMNVKDPDGLKEECLQGKALGFDGKTLIHPAQLDIANTVFGPNADEVDKAEQMIKVWTDAEQNGEGVCLFEGRLVEHLHVTQARTLLSLAAEVKARESDS